MKRAKTAGTLLRKVGTAPAFAASSKLIDNFWWGQLDLNQRPIGYEPTALTAELWPHMPQAANSVSIPAITPYS